MVENHNEEKQTNGAQNKFRGEPPTTQRINFGDDEMVITGFQFNVSKNYLTYLIYVISLGLIRLFFHWYPQYKLYATHSKCSLNVADTVLIEDTYKRKFKSYFVKAVRILEPVTCSEEKNKLYGITTNGKTFTKNLPEILPVRLENGTEKYLLQVRTIKCKKLSYIWDTDEEKFVRLVGLDIGKKHGSFHQYKGLGVQEQYLRRIIYGNNEINVPVQSILTLLLLEALTPFYIFQVFSILVWVAEAYFYYGIAIVAMSAYGITSSIIQTRKNQKNLKGTVSSADWIMVSRGNGDYEKVQTSDLVPGDIILIPSEGCEMQCDAILLNGHCIVNESMLTGESIPVTKTALSNDPNYYHLKEDANHTLFCGTKVIQTKLCGEDKIVAVVIRTGYLTAKGELVRSIMYPPPADFKFDQDSYKFIGILALISVLGIVYTIVSKSSREIAPLDILIKSLDLITICIPSALPAAMTVGKLYALGRLKRSRIYCINSRVINVSGSINCVCFDKTGTLTEDELDMWGVVPVENMITRDPVKNINQLDFNSNLLRGMLTCHSLTMIDDKLCGYPLDIKMFESTGWIFEEPINLEGLNSNILPSAVVKTSDGNSEIYIFRQFQFSSTLQRSSVITRKSDEVTYEIYCKGSPESIIMLSRPETVPADITEKLKHFTEKGYRVIAVAARKLNNSKPSQINNMIRRDVECDLEFSGLIVLENKLKSQTTGVIKTLKEANMKVVMITGDNIQTAVSVGKECGIISKTGNIIEITAPNPDGKCGTNHQILSQFFETHYQFPEKKFYPDHQMRNRDPEISDNQNQIVITGNSWGNVVEHLPELIPTIVDKGVVFARMSGYQKQQLIEELKNVGFYVAMCGDGANDCAALKAAHLGISLSEAEASIASPFTSKEPNISCVTKIIREGRAALITSFGVFKLMLCYSLAEFTSTIILYGIDGNLTSMQFLFIDVCLVLNFASFFGNTRAYELLDKIPPPTSMLSFVPMASLILFMIQVVGFQLVSFYLIQTYEWFTPFVYNHKLNDLKCFENYAIFVVSMFQYICMAIVFSKGTPYRKPIYTNKLFSCSILFTVIICSFITAHPPSWIVNALELEMPPVTDVRFALLGIALANLISFLLVEHFVINFVLCKLIRPKLMGMKKTHTNLDGSTVDLWPVLGCNKPVIAVINEKKSGIFNESYNVFDEDILATTKC